MAPARSYDFRDLGLLSGPSDPVFVTCCRLAAELLGTEYAKITLVDVVADRILIRAAFGFDPEGLGLDLEHTDFPLCRQIIGARVPVHIDEANDVLAAKQSPFLASLKGRSYLGAPIFDPADSAVGTLCAIGQRPRIWSERQKEQITELAGLLSQAITLKAALATIRLLSPPVAQK